METSHRAPQEISACASQPGRRPRPLQWSAGLVCPRESADLHRFADDLSCPACLGTVFCQSFSKMIKVPQPYLLFLGDVTEARHAKSQREWLRMPVADPMRGGPELERLVEACLS